MKELSGECAARCKQALGIPGVMLKLQKFYPFTKATKLERQIRNFLRKRVKNCLGFRLHDPQNLSIFLLSAYVFRLNIGSVPNESTSLNTHLQAWNTKPQLLLCRLVEEWFTRIQILRVYTQISTKEERTEMLVRWLRLDTCGLFLTDLCVPNTLCSSLSSICLKPKMSV